MVAWLFHFRERKRLFLRFPWILHLNDQRVFMIKQIYCLIEVEEKQKDLQTCFQQNFYDYLIYKSKYFILLVSCLHRMSRKQTHSIYFYSHVISLSKWTKNCFRVFIYMLYSVQNGKCGKRLCFMNTKDNDDISCRSKRKL